MKDNKQTENEKPETAKDESPETTADTASEEEAYTGILGDFQETEAEEAAEAAAEAEAKAEEQAAEAEKAAEAPKKSGKGAAIAGVTIGALLLGALGGYGIYKMRTAPTPGLPTGDKSEAAIYTENLSVSPEMMQYYYKDMIESFRSYYGEDALKAYYGLDLSAPLSSQTYSEEDGSTWRDMMVDQAVASVIQQLILSEAGRAEGFKMDDAAHKQAEEQLASIDLAAYGVTEETARMAAEMQAYVSSYYTYVMDSMTFTDDEIQAYYDANEDKYVTCGLMGFTISYPTEEEATDAATEAADAATEADAETETAAATEAETEAATEAATEDDGKPDMTKEIAKGIADELEAVKSPEEYESIVRSYLAEYEGYSDDELDSIIPQISNDAFSKQEGLALSDWAFGGAKVGDTHVIEGDGAYYVYLLTREPGRDESATVNVRPILFTTDSFLPEGADSSDPAVTAEAMEKAHAEADRVLAEWQNGEATEDSFAALAEQYTEDPGSRSTGGLYENVQQGQMVPAFNDWCFDPSRQTGDTGIVETEYGVHVMYFSGNADPLWKSQVISALKDERYQTWYAEQEALYPVTKNDELLAGIGD